MAMALEKMREMRAILNGSGVRAALIFLNGQTDHRFSALYRFDDETLKNLYFFDREQPELDYCPDIPIMVSYCVFVRSEGRTFVTTNSEGDARVEGHPKRFEVRSYCGVPLIDENGKMFGTICHFDFQPKGITDENVALTEAMAQLIPSRNP
ncbi:MAG TPA: GAF domain-containing protein [Tepidisphaeraceae bacterium]|jgi:GAF domain-containing protein